jgi:hypothetical protein
MAANGAQQAFAPVLGALATMSASVDRAQKGQAHEFLEKFQKSVSVSKSPGYQATELTQPFHSLRHGQQHSRYFNQKALIQELNCSPRRH